MSYVKIVVDFVGVLFELYFATLLFNSLWEKRENVPGPAVYTALVLFLSAAAYIPFLKSFTTVELLVALLVLSLLYEAGWLARIFYAFFIMLGLLLSEMVVGLTMAAILGGSVEQNIDNLNFYTAGVIFSKFIMYIIIRIVVLHKERKTYTGLLEKMPQMVILSTVTVYVTMVIFFLSYGRDNILVIILTVVTVLMLIVANILIFIFSDKVLQQEMKLQRLAFGEEQFKLQEEYYKEILSRHREIRRIRHDMNNYLLSLSGYIEEDQKELALEKINQHRIHIKKDDYIQCDNLCMAALLNAKYHIIQSEKIDFDYRIQIPEKIEADDTDLCIVVGNLMDNAIEACCKFAGYEERKLQLEISLKGEYIEISLTNSVCEGYEPRKDGRTIKNAKEAHGFGKENVRMIAEKYNGNADFVYKDHCFTANVMMRNIKVTDAV